MAKIDKKKFQKATKKIFTSPFSIYWGSINYYILIAGCILAIIGFYLMSVKPFDSSASVVFSPIILMIAYVIIIPFAILYKKKTDNSENNQAGSR
jgi:membrane protein YdbS with pleckstrin-like domain